VDRIRDSDPEGGQGEGGGDADEASQPQHGLVMAGTARRHGREPDGRLRLRDEDACFERHTIGSPGSWEI
jgi:hypothetical protein